MHAEANALHICCHASFLDALGIRIERVDARRTSGCERRQPTLPTTDVDDARALERDELLDPPGLDRVQVGDVHV